MPPRSAIFDLPVTVRDELNGRLIANGFSDYVALSEWLLNQGYTVSKSAVHRWGQELEAEFSGAMADARRAAELGRALSGDDDGSGLRRATTAMAQETLLRILMSLRKAEAAATDEDGGDPAALAKSLSLVTRSLADLGRLGLAETKYLTEQKAAMAQEFITRAEAAVSGQGEGLTAVNAITAMRQLARDMYGV